MRRTIGVIVGAGLAVAAAKDLGAQAWVHLPNGRVGYVVSYLTTGFFQCGPLIRGCIANGNTLTVTNGGSSMTLTFSGVQTTVTAPNTQPARTLMGTMSYSVSGAGFVFPPPSNIDVNYIAFNMMVAVPGGWGSVWNGGYLLRNGGLHGYTCCGDGTGRTWVGLPILVPPPFHATYSMVTMEQFNNPNIPVGTGSFNFYASASLTPEPATITLLATGLAGVLGGTFAGKRRRRSRRESLEKS